MAEFYRRKRKICQMCAGKGVDYKDVNIINKYINEKERSCQEEWLEHVLNIKDILQPSKKSTLYGISTICKIKVVITTFLFMKVSFLIYLCYNKID